MPGGQGHKVNDQFQTDAAAVMSDEQFDRLTAMLEAHQERLEGLIKPIHDIAVLLLADHAGTPAKGDAAKIKASDKDS